MKVRKRTIILVATLTLAITGGCEFDSLRANADNAVVDSEHDNESERAEPVRQERSVGNNTVVTRGLVAKMLTLAFHDMNSIGNREFEVKFSDLVESSWENKYINKAFLNGIMSGVGDESFMPTEPITLEQAQMLLDKLDQDNQIKIKITEETKGKAISMELWIELYRNLLENLSGDKSIREMYGIEEKNHVVLATGANNGKILGFNMITDRGLVSFDGLNMDSYIDKEIRVLQKEDEILAVVAVVSETPMLRSAYIVGNDRDKITVFSGGCERTYEFENNLNNIAGKIGDILINAGKAERVVVHDQEIKGQVLKLSPTEVELKESGMHEIASNFKIYSDYDGYARLRRLSDIVVGADCVFIENDGKIISAVLREKPVLDKLRVVINTENFNGLYHEKISISATSEFHIETNGELRNFESGQVVQIEPEMFTDLNRIRIIPKEENGKLILDNVKRNWSDNESPKYRGIFEIEKTNDGYVLINELDIDEYLYAVLPSEMPSSHGIEANKVQAVTARSYAYNQFYANRFHRQGANIDDSVSSQVYNNIPENEISIKAVNDTRGKFLTHNDRVISANFFSTSSGMTANQGEVWSAGTFPSTTSEYLSAKKQHKGEDFGDLRVEENMNRFIRRSDIDSYDKDFVWFRWNVELNAEEIAASINQNLATRYSANPKLIKTLESDGVFRSSEISSIGEFVDMEVMKRGEAGNIMEMKVIGTEATILILTEYNIRMLIKPYQYLPSGREIKLYASRGVEMNNYSIMPSAFYVIEKSIDDQGSVSTVKFIGGGNGHGVGMSQNGVKGMIDAGYEFEQILKHYYTGIEISEL